MVSEIKLESGEELLLSLTCHTEVENAHLAKSILFGALFFPMGRVNNTFTLSLTSKYLYLEQLSYSPWGNLPEVVNSDRYPVDEIKEFKVKLLEDDKELIKITSKDGKYIDLINNNKKKTFIGSKMSNLIDK